MEGSPENDLSPDGFNGGRTNYTFANSPVFGNSPTNSPKKFHKVDPIDRERLSWKQKFNLGAFNSFVADNPAVPNMKIQSQQIHGLSTSSRAGPPLTASQDKVDNTKSGSKEGAGADSSKVSFCFV